MNKVKKELMDNKNATSFLEQIAGPLAPSIVKIFTEQAMSPEDISKKLNQKITTVRSTLNSLHYRGIACYKKKRDDKNMYEFLWEIKYKKIIEILLLQEMKKFKSNELTINDKETHDFFYCPNKCIEVAFEIAAAYNFHCPTCNKNLELTNTKNKLNNLKKQNKEIESNIKKLEGLLEKIQDNTTGYICE